MMHWLSASKWRNIDGEKGKSPIGSNILALSRTGKDIWLFIKTWHRLCTIREKLQKMEANSIACTVKDIWLFIKIWHRLCTIREKLQKMEANSIAAAEDAITSRVLMIDREAIICIDLYNYRRLDDQKVKIDNFLSNNRAIGMVGMGGTGKSALA
ncbi:Uncharacterized protein Fot_50579 [Forsythia ovata]|uniref:Uncharacterized protein n=1 Tax=Forsythia ovata TaxID=205694 RepID=A0ABD1PYK1_9LAMI